MKRSSVAPCRSLTIFAFFVSVLVIAPIAIVWAQSGGSQDLRRNVIAGGGGTSTGSGNLQVTGTVGQPAAGTQTSGGTLKQTGGFWPGALAQTPTAAPGIISGRVTTTDGAPLAGVVMNLSGARLMRTITDANGLYSLTSVDTGAFYTVTPLRVNYAFSPANRSFSLVGNNINAAFTAIPISETGNPLETPEFFVRQHYLDFLSREPDRGGFEYWSQQINRCNGDQACTRARSIDVSNAFFYELEFQQTGSYAFRLYRAAFGNNQPFSNPDNSTEAKKLPSYAVFARDRARVVGGADLAQRQLDLANVFVARAEFLAKYPANLNGSSFIDAVLNTIKNDSGVDLAAQKPGLLTLFNAGERGAVMYRLADDSVSTNPIINRTFIDAEYNRAFVFTQYAGYLRRDADIGGFLFWLGQVNAAPLRDVARQHAMVCSFITSSEYQQRFSLVVTHTNADCSP